ncbi:hypothetical protein REPUB_Repub04eG0219400 [Reevesia pubescens]
MCTLTLSASIPALKPAECVGFICPSATPAQYAAFFTGLYLIALGSGGIKPCLSSFGADQFDDTDPKERLTKGSFFNWYYFSVNIGALISSSLLVWVQDNIGWGLGFGIPALSMGLANGSFFSDAALYRFQGPGGSPITRICQVLVASFRKWNLKVPEDSSLLYETVDKNSAIQGSRKLEHTDELKCIDKAAIVTDAEVKNGDFSNRWRLCTVTQSGGTENLDPHVSHMGYWNCLLCCICPNVNYVCRTRDDDGHISWVIVPIARKFTGKERGFSELQRMGIGLFLSILCMSAAVVVEIRRLQLAKELGLVDKQVAVPLSIFWQIPQYFLLGAAQVCTFVGQLEFFYDQSPDAMRSLCSALSLLTTALGNYLSSFILTLVTYVTTKGRPAWLDTR